MPDSAHDARSEAGWYPSGLRLGLGQERGLRRWPANRIRPKSIALGVRSLFAEVDALRIQLAASEAALARAEARTAGLVKALFRPADDPRLSMSGMVCRLCGWDTAPDWPEEHEPSCLLFDDGADGRCTPRISVCDRHQRAGGEGTDA
jgi:hypothetical protein